MLQIIINLLNRDDINTLSILHHMRIKVIIFLCILMPFIAYAQGIPNRLLKDDLILPKRTHEQHLVKTSKAHLLNVTNLNKNVNNKLSSLAVSTILWDDQLVNDDASGVCLHENSGCAMDGSGNYTVVWEDYRTGNSDIYLQQYNSSGTIVGTNIRVNDDGQGIDHYYPAIASNSTGKTAVAWVDERSGSSDIYLQWFDASGTRNGTNIQVNDNTGTVYSAIHSVAVAVDGNGNTIVVWVKVTNGYFDLYLQRFNSSGVAQGVNIQVNDDASGTTYHFRPAIGVDGSGNSVIVWQDYRNGNYDIYLQRYDGTGASLGVNIEVNDDGGTTDQAAPTIAINNSGAEIITWHDLRNGNRDIYMQRYSASGTAQGSNVMVNDDAGTASQYYPTVGIDLTGNSIITWYDYRNTDIDIYLQRYNASGVAQGSNVKVNSNAVAANQYYPWVSINSTGVGVISWEDYRISDGENIYHQRINTSGAFLGSNVKVNSDVNDASQWAPSVGMDGNNNSIIVWEDQRNGNYDIYMQHLNASGAVLGSNIKVNDDNIGAYHYFPFVAVNTSGNGVVVWKDSRNGYYDVYLQYYNTSGSAIGSNVKVNDVSTSASPYDNCLTAAMDGSGNSVVVWEDDRNGSNYDIYMQRYNSSGTPVGSNTRVNDDAAYTYVHNQPSVGVDGGGNIIVTWYDNRDGSNHIYVQRYYASGGTNGANIRIGDNVPSEQYSPTIAVTSSGASVIVWEDYRNGDDIYLQRFDASGNPVGINTKVNDNGGTSERYWPSVVFDGNSNFLVAWQDYRNGQPDIIGQWYSASGIANGGNVLIVHDGVNHLEMVPRLAASGQNLVCTWQDNRRSKGYDIYAKSFSSGWMGYSAPAAPQNLTATAGNGQVTLTWNKNTESDFLLYRIYSGISSNPTKKIDSTSGGITDTVRVISGLTNGTIYYFRITAVNNTGAESGFSNEVNAMPSSTLANGLVAFYPFNGNANDESGNGNNGTNYGATLTTGRLGSADGAYSFDGSSSYISVPNSSSLKITGDITVCAWVKTSTPQFTKGIIEKYYSGTQNDHGWLLDTYTDGGAMMEGRDGRGGTFTLRSNSSAAFADNQWHFIVGQRSGNIWKVYLDNQLSNSVDAGGTAGSIESGGKMTIGSFSNTTPVNGVWSGAIDGIRIYNRALSDAEIADLYHEGGWNPNTPPAAPSNLTATVGNSQVKLTWNRNTESDFLRYRIYGGTSSNPTIKIDSTIGGSSDTTKTISGLTNGTIYYFRITAIDSAGLESGFSNEVNATPSAVVDNTPPIISVNTPTGTPVIVSANGQVSSSPQVSASASDAGSGISRMRVAYRNTSEQSWSVLAVRVCCFNQFFDSPK